MAAFLYLPLAAAGTFIFVNSPYKYDFNAWIDEVSRTGQISPGVALRTVYTGVGAIDSMLGVFSAVFFNFVDGSNAHSRAFAAYFLLSLIPFIAQFEIESWRPRNRHHLSA